MRRFLAVTLFLFAAAAAAVQAQSAPPAPQEFFMDLVSGPATGGQNSRGAIVTVYGRGFGATQGSSTVTIGGAPAAAYLIWSDGKISFAIGAAAQSGPVVVHTAGGDGNGLPFTVRAGAIKCVDPAGSDSATGDWGSCWKTLMKAKQAVIPGTIVYLMDGVSYTVEDSVDPGLRSSFNPDVSGTAAAPIAWIAYPGATATIGSPTGPDIGIRNERNAVFQVFSGLTLRARHEAVEAGGGEGWRVVGNDISCPNGNAPEGCFEASWVMSNTLYFLGNDVHDVSVNVAGGPTKQYHAVYFTTNANHIVAAWNRIHGNATCRAIQFHSSDGPNQFDLSVHDNVIDGDACDGINLATIDPSKGSIVVSNNVIARVGRGPAPPDGDANYACIYLAGSTNFGSPGSGKVSITNNTMYDCGSHAAPWSGGGNGAVGVFGPVGATLAKNVISMLPGEPYLESGSAGVSGDGNLFFGNGVPPSGFTGSVSVDPRFTNVAAGNFTATAPEAAGLGATGAGAVPQPQSAAGQTSNSVTLAVLPAVSVSISPSAANLPAGTAQQFTATVTNDVNAQGVTWTISPALGSISGAGLYTAPDAVTATAQVTVTATSAADPRKSAMAAITLAVPVPPSPQPPPPVVPPAPPQPAAPPAIVLIAPAQVFTDTGAFTLTVNGSGFTASSAVLLDGAPVETIFVSATQVKANVPASAIQVTGTKQVAVQNPA